jgi:hypothetical protein
MPVWTEVIRVASDDEIGWSTDAWFNGPSKREDALARVIELERQGAYARAVNSCGDIIAATTGRP